jgi:hypothetical protein
MNPIAIVLFVLLAIVIWQIWQESRQTTGIRRGSNLDRDLLAAVKGDTKLAERLLEQARFKYPGKSETWYVEKVIYDINRDRGFIRSPQSRPIKNSKTKRIDILRILGISWAINTFRRLIQKLRS